MADQVQTETVIHPWISQSQSSPHTPSACESLLNPDHQCRTLFQALVLDAPWILPHLCSTGSPRPASQTAPPGHSPGLKAPASPTSPPLVIMSFEMGLPVSPSSALANPPVPTAHLSSHPYLLQWPSHSPAPSPLWGLPASSSSLPDHSQRKLPNPASRRSLSAG